MERRKPSQWASFCPHLKWEPASAWEESSHSGWHAAAGEEELEGATTGSRRGTDTLSGRPMAKPHWSIQNWNCLKCKLTSQVQPLGQWWAIVAADPVFFPPHLVLWSPARPTPALPSEHFWSTIYLLIHAPSLPLSELEHWETAVLGLSRTLTWRTCDFCSDSSRGGTQVK